MSLKNLFEIYFIYYIKIRKNFYDTILVGKFDFDIIKNFFLLIVSIFSVFNFEKDYTV